MTSITPKSKWPLSPQIQKRPNLNDIYHLKDLNDIYHVKDPNDINDLNHPIHLKEWDYLKDVNELMDQMT